MPIYRNADAPQMGRPSSIGIVEAEQKPHSSSKAMKGPQRSNLERHSHKNQGRDFEFNFGRYTKKMLRSIYPDKSRVMAEETSKQLDELLFNAFDGIAEEARKLLLKENKKTLSHHDVETATRLYFRGALGQKAVQEGRNAMNAWIDK